MLCCKEKMIEVFFDNNLTGQRCMKCGFVIKDNITLDELVRKYSQHKMNIKKNTP